MKGFILWFTGMSGAGKSTLSRLVAAELQRHCPVELLDGDEVRTYLSEGLSFSKEDRDRNVRRIGYVATLLAKHGVTVVTAAISPYAAARDEVRRLAEAAGVRMLVVQAQAKLESLVRRDVKGLYKRALAGELPHFTGVSDPYEPAVDPDVVVRTDEETVSESVQRIVSMLARHGLVPPIEVEVPHGTPTVTRS